MNLIGEFQINLDPKGRLLIPAGIKKQLAEDELDEMVINRGFEKCLIAYPKKTWDAVSKKLNSLNDFNPKAREFKRLFLNGATMIELDKIGRILIPKALLDYSQLEKDVVLVSLGNKVEIWSKSNYDAYMADKMSGFSDLASEVAGGDFFNLD